MNLLAIDSLLAYVEVCESEGPFKEGGVGWVFRWGLTVSWGAVVSWVIVSAGVGREFIVDFSPVRWRCGTVTSLSEGLGLEVEVDP